MSKIRDMSASNSQKLLLNQVRHRILQYIYHQGNATVKDIRDALSDIPQATLYRQVKVLNENGFIDICGKRRVRGTLEHTYRLADGLLTSDTSRPGDASTQFALYSIAQDFADYSMLIDADPDRDMLNLRSMPLMMSDAEFTEYLRSINKLTEHYIHNEPVNGRRARRVTFISSPEWREMQG